MTPLELIWNGWRSEYIAGTADAAGSSDVASGSVFSRILASGMSDVEANIVRRGQSTFAILNAFPYTTGHVMVLPYREVAALEELDEAEAGELWPMVTAAVRAAKVAYAPGGVNVGINLGRAAGGSVNEHLHVHVVPRWAGDGNFMTSIANARTLPEPLIESARRLRSAWPA